ncbi:ArsC family protein [Emticicia oligotrophica DSM 17448]|uniref:ArsC family protein n=1 Tax=Emticicia oligotrophica (strain DSM 17448 / CIP 109782 / MTCC 6937 / GPTSA100-15) TaxID=929562 RepID=A0ABM5N2R6_EMTOG|nr:ArsC family reductase [Emticicia oligotrophica]AFK03706.1 ArsC family protein [Emticicia oligotrophica DSM 17448]
MLTVYGIPNCDTVKKALTWLKDHNIAFEFHDYKKKGITPEKLEEWLTQVPYDKLVNRAGTTFKKLTEEEKANITDNASAIALMLEKTSVIKRPIVESDKILAMGFKAEDYEEVFG